MNIVLNGRPTQVPDDATVADVVRTITEAATGIAVALDGEVVSRSEWENRTIDDGQSVEVLKAVQGG